jgi:hypothetical protein
MEKGKLHPQYGLNVSVERCKYCKDEGPIVFNGSNCEQQAKPTMVDCTMRCEFKRLTVLIEMDEEKETGYVVVCDAVQMSSMGFTPGPNRMQKSELEKFMGKNYGMYGEVKIDEV